MENTLRIAMYGHKRIPSREGGIEIVVEELSRRMVQKEHYVCCYSRKGRHVSGIEFDKSIVGDYEGIRLKSVLTVDRKGFAVVTSSFCSAMASAFGKYDVVHIHAEGSAVFSWIPKLLGKKVVLTIHGLDWGREKWKGGFGSKYILFGERMGVKFADEIIVLSKNVQEYFKKTYGRNTVFIPNGVNRPEKKVLHVITDKYDLYKDEYILFLGRLVPEKGVRYLIEAFKKVNTDKKLVIAGGASDTDEFVNELKKSAADDKRIIFTGFVQGEIVDELYGNAYIYVLPSDLEGMPLSLLEAMSYGNCCVVSDIPECTEVVEDNAVIFPKSNIDALSECLKRLCDDVELVMNYKSNAADFICQRYSWDEVVSRTLTLYRKT